MAVAMTNFLEDLIVKHLFLGTAYTAGQTWLGLFTVAPSDNTAGTEVTGNAYARQRVFQNLSTVPYWDTETVGTDATVVSNVQVVTFPQASPSGWGTIVAAGIFDASAAGNLTWWGTLPTPTPVGALSQFSFAAGAVIVGLD